MIDPKQLGHSIRTLREERGLNQDDVAGSIGISRVAISHIEQGTRGVSFLELAKIAQLLGVSTDDFLRAEPLVDVTSTASSEVMFSSVKLRNVLLYILARCAGKPNIGETVMYKLLYFIDFDHYELTQQPVTGLEYIHLQYGPAPVARQYVPVIDAMKINGELKIIVQEYFGMRMKRYINLVEYPLGSLSPYETKVIDDVINRMGDWSARQIESYVHADAPWVKTQDRQIIPYSLVFNRVIPYAKVPDEIRQFSVTSGNDVLKELGSQSHEDYDYYESL